MSDEERGVKLIDLLDRKATPAPWEEADNIPWNEAAFSARMLREHLSQRHDRASRRNARIDGQIEWLHRDVLKERPSRIVDLACGPGLYTSRLSALGHVCLGIDYSPAAIEHARAEAPASCHYLEADIRQTDYGDQNDLVTFIYGEFNSLRPDDAEQVLNRAHSALADGGQLVIEAHTEAKIREIGSGAAHWYSAPRGVFSNQPHLVLTECFWNKKANAATQRYFVVKVESGAVERYAQSAQAYSDDAYRALLSRCGFRKVEIGDEMAEVKGGSNEGLITLVATR